MSSGPSVNEALQAYLAGRLTASQLAAVVAPEYYRETRNGKRETWRPIMDVIERAHPGIVELTSSTNSPGFAVRLAERPFPKKLEGELREAVTKVLDTGSTLPASPVPLPGFFGRIIRAIRKIFRG
jgi:hypothetical protein